MELNARKAQCPTKPNIEVEIANCKTFEDPTRLPSNQSRRGFNKNRKGTTEVKINKPCHVNNPTTTGITPTTDLNTTKITAIMPSSSNLLQLHGTGLPSFLFTNIQSFGNSESADNKLF